MLEQAGAADVPRVGQNEATLLMQGAKESALFGGCTGH
jgi:hypothetical protein